MREALRRDSGEATETAWPDPKNDPAPDQEYVKPADPEPETEAAPAADPDAPPADQG
jgi:hypothetical protein